MSIEGFLMEWASPLLEGNIIKRYKRFLADVQLSEGGIVTAHVANTGSMATCWEPGQRALLSFHDNPQRKLKYSLEMTHNGQTWIGVNTSLPNKLAIEGIDKGVITELQGYETIHREVKTGDSRIDILLEDPSLGQCYVEVKNVTMKGPDGLCLFPDAVSTRGQKHLRRLTQLKEQAFRSAILFIVQREDTHTFTPAEEIDPSYAQLLRKAFDRGVEILVYQCHLSPEEIKVRAPLPFTFF